MPEVGRFDGIVVRIHTRDHPPPHFHVYYNEFEATYEIETLQALEGYLPAAQYGKLLEWASENEEALASTWRAIHGD